MGSDRYAEFNEWCAGSMPEMKGEKLELTKKLPGRQPTSQQFENIITEVVTGIQNQSIATFDINRSVPEGEYILDYQGDGNNTLASLRITSAVPKGSLTVRGLKIWNVQLLWQGHTDISEPIVFENCEIANLTLVNDSRVTLAESKVGNLIIMKTHQIHMMGGCVLNIQVAAPGLMHL